MRIKTTMIRVGNVSEVQNASAITESVMCDGPLGEEIRNAGKGVCITYSPVSFPVTLTLEKDCDVQECTMIKF